MIVGQMIEVYNFMLQRKQQDHLLCSVVGWQAKLVGDFAQEVVHVFSSRCSLLREQSLVFPDLVPRPSVGQQLQYFDLPFLQIPPFFDHFQGQQPFQTLLLGLLFFITVQQYRKERDQQHFEKRCRKVKRKAIDPCRKHTKGWEKGRYFGDCRDKQG